MAPASTPAAKATALELKTSIGAACVKAGAMARACLVAPLQRTHSATVECGLSSTVKLCHKGVSDLLPQSTERFLTFALVTISFGQEYSLPLGWKSEDGEVFTIFLICSKLFNSPVDRSTLIQVREFSAGTDGGRHRCTVSK